MIPSPGRAAVAVTLAVAMGPGFIDVPSGHAHGAKSEVYTASAPQPLPSHGADGGCSDDAQEGFSKDSHPFEMTKSGVLSVRMDGFDGDWDLHIESQATGETLASSATHRDPRDDIRIGGGGQAVDIAERISIGLMPSQAVSIVACNFAGGPTATVSFGFTQGPIVSVGRVAVAEGDAGSRAAVFTLSLSEPSATNVTVAYATADGTATAHEDYSPVTGVANFAPGSAFATVKVPLVGDSIPESDETLALQLAAPDRAVLGAGTGTATVVDDDPGPITPQLSIGDAAVHEGKSGSRSAVFTVGLSRPADTDITVAFRTVSASAIKVYDYTAKSGTITFAAGTTGQKVKVPIVPDTRAEGDEAFTVLLFGDGVAIADASGLGTILDDD